MNTESIQSGDSTSQATTDPFAEMFSRQETEKAEATHSNDPAGGGAEQTEVKTPTPTQPNAVALTEEQLARILERTGGQVQQQGQPAQEDRPMTEQEFKKAFAYYEANEDLVGRIMQGGPDAAKALNEMISGIYKHLNLVSVWRAQEQLEKFEKEKFSPLSSKFDKEVTPFVQNMQTERMNQVGKSHEEQFLQTFPDLKPYKKYVDRVVGDVTADITNGRMKFSGKDLGSISKEVHQEISNRVRAELKDMGINVSAQPSRGGSSGYTNTRPATKPQPASMMVGGTGGNANGGSSNSKISQMEAFVKRK